MIVQMVILNFYHKAPLVPVPDWLRHFTRCLGCHHFGSQVGSTSVNSANTSDVNLQDVKRINRASNGKHLSEDDNRVLGDVCKITDETATRAAEEAMRGEWQVVACMMDKFCFWFFVLLQVVLVASSFGIIPHS